MNPIVQWLIYGLPSLLVGVALGRWLHREVEAEVVAHEYASSEEIPTVDRPRWSSTVPARVLGAVVVLITIVSAVLISQGQSRVEQIAEQGDRRAACNVTVLTELIGALNEQNELTQETSEAHREKVRALVTALTFILSGSNDRERGREVFEDYLEKSQAYLDLSEEQSEVRREHPIPSLEDLEACR